MALPSVTAKGQQEVRLLGGCVGDTRTHEIQSPSLQCEVRAMGAYAEAVAGTPPCRGTLESPVVAVNGQKPRRDP